MPETPRASDIQFEMVRSIEALLRLGEQVTDNLNRINITEKMVALQELKISLMIQDIQSLMKQVSGGNGTAPISTRLALLEKTSEDIAEDRKFFRRLKYEILLGVVLGSGFLSWLFRILADHAAHVAQTPH